MGLDLRSSSRVCGNSGTTSAGSRDTEQSSIRYTNTCRRLQCGGTRGHSINNSREDMGANASSRKRQQRPSDEKLLSKAGANGGRHISEWMRVGLQDAYDHTSPESDDAFDRKGPRPPPLASDEIPDGVGFSEDDVAFTPSYEAYTPSPTSDLKYKSPERRHRGVLAPPSTVSRPNVEDTLRRVSIVLHKHICTCEMRLQLAHLVSQREARARSESDRLDVSADEFGEVDDMPESDSDLFHRSKISMFQEDAFVSPQFLYKFVRVPIARPGICYSMKQVKTTFSIPTPDELYTFMRTLFTKAALSSECAIVCLIYVERLMEIAHVPLVAVSWRPIVLCGLLLASKVWQDLSSWNVEFSQIYPHFTLQSINRLERLFLNELKWDLYISSSLYAKYYFALRSLYEKRDIRRRYNLLLNVNPPKADQISARSGAVKSDLKDILSRSF